MSAHQPSGGAKARRWRPALIVGVLAAMFPQVASTPTASAQTVETATWTQKNSATSPDPRYVTATATDGVTGDVMVAGGYDGTNPKRELWAWNGVNWQLRSTSGPSARYGSGMASDPEFRGLLLFGGYNPTEGYRGDTWIWNGLSWVQRTPNANDPSPRRYAAMAHDPVLDQTVLFGGYNAGTKSDTYVFTDTGWSLGASGPPARALATLVYDPVRLEMVMFGGGNGTANLNDTWVWDGDSWEQRTDPDGVVPPARWGQQMAWDALSNTVVLYGGFDGTNHLDDTWAWDGEGWTELEPANFPSARSFGGLAPHPATGDLVLFGGHDGTTPLAETWAFGPQAEASFEVWHSPDCTNGAVVFDGFTADNSTYLKLRTHNEPNGDRWVCFRVDSGAVHGGGKLVVGAADPGVPGLPTNDGEACGANAATNQLPGPHPLVSGNVGPDNVHVEADAWFDGEEAWACVIAGTLSRRVAVPVASVSGASLLLDNPAPYAFPDDWPIGVPSGQCKAQGGSATLDHLNSDIGSDAGHVWLTTWQESVTRAHLCFRANTVAGDRGAIITVDTTGAPGVTPTLGTDANTAPCTVNLLDFTNPVTFFLKVSPAGNPVSTCVKVGGTEVRAFAGTSGAAVLPITCTEDPGTGDIC